MRANSWSLTVQVNEFEYGGGRDLENRDIDLGQKDKSYDYSKEEKESAKDLDKTYTLFWGSFQLTLWKRSNFKLNLRTELETAHFSY